MYDICLTVTAWCIIGLLGVLLIRSICCPVRNAALIFEMPMESRRYTTPTDLSVGGFSTAPAAQRKKPSGCVKIGL